jgi:predicted TIM-barrel enzyme
MLKSLLKYLPVSSVKVGSGEKTATMQSLSIQMPDGYHAPVAVINAWVAAARTIRDDIIVLCHGGPIAEPEDAAYSFVLPRLSWFLRG